MLTRGETPFNHSHHGCDVLECSRMRIALQVAQIECQNALSCELAAIRLLIGVDITYSLDSARYCSRQFESLIVLRDEQGNAWPSMAHLRNFGPKIVNTYVGGNQQNVFNLVADPPRMHCL